MVSAKEPSKEDLVNARCLAKIETSYPKAKCGMQPDKNACNDWCQKMGGNCNGGKIEVRKLTCQRSPIHIGDQTCCCDVKCEDEKAIEKRLEAELKSSVKTNGTCITANRSSIKAALNKACHADDKIHIMKKYCTDELNGKYFCLTQGRCLGTHCRGCASHECEYDGKSNGISVPANYIQKHLKMEETEVVDIDKRVSNQWCTVMMANETCSALCKGFGEKWCMSSPKSKGIVVKPCNDTTKGCQCCCNPQCDPDATTSCSPSSKETQMLKHKVVAGVTRPSSVNDEDDNR